jgi:hypothetical protein
VIRANCFRWRAILGAAVPASLLPASLLAAPIYSASATPLSQVPLQRLVNSLSTNWSGYAATSGRFTSVSASWIQPSVSCTNKSTYSSFWVGLDGDGSNSVEQTGTEADCSHGKPVYFGWYEMYPAAPVNYGDVLKAGDALKASVTTDGSGQFTLTVSDATEHWTETQTQSSSSASLASAEVIAEAPFHGTVLPLADFGTVDFTSAVANGKAIGSFNPDEITMVTTSGAIKALPSALSSGEDFSDTWHHT